MHSKLRQIVSQWGDLDVPIDTLNEQDNLYEAGLSSLSTVKILMAIESEFGIELPDDMLTRDLFSSVDSLSRAVTGLLSGRAAA
jgi:acyl carrier protein